MTTKEEIKKLRALFYSDFLDDEFDDVGVWNCLEKDLEILEILKKVIMITRNKHIGAYDGCYCLKLKRNIIPSEETANKIKEWLDEK